MTNNTMIEIFYWTILPIRQIEKPLSPTGKNSDCSIEARHLWSRLFCSQSSL